MKNGLVLSLVATATLVAGCATAPVSQTYEVTSYDKAWSCAISTASQLGMSVINSSKESGTIFGQKATDDVTVSLVKIKNGVTAMINRSSNTVGILTSGSFPQDFQNRYGACISG